jgi:hypothetical protein
VFGAGLAVSACGSSEASFQPTRTEVAVLVDRTEAEEHNRHQLGEAEIERILKLVTRRVMDDARRHGGSITIYLIADNSVLRNVPGNSIPVGGANENPFVRFKTIDRFNASVKDSMNRAVPDRLNQDGPEGLTYQQSFIVQPLCQFLETVDGASRPHTRRVLLIYSDLLEHSPLFSFYKHSEEYVQEHRDEIVDRFMTECGNVTTPVAAAVQIVQQPLAKGQSDTKHLQARRTFQAFFQRLGLQDQSVLN